MGKTMKVIDSLWFTNLDGCVGIIVIEEDVTGDRKAYIGPASGEEGSAIVWLHSKVESKRN